MVRASNHVEPIGLLQIARHYVRELIYGANDGIITTFAVVAGVAGGGLALRVVLIIGAANLLADGLSMAVGNYLSIRSHESVLEAQNLPDKIAILRLDTDFYESTKAELETLYPRLSPGGELIVDDYGEWAGARKAVDEYFSGQAVWLHYVTHTVRLMIKP